MESPDNLRAAYAALAPTFRSTWNPRAAPGTAEVLKPIVEARHDRAERDEFFPLNDSLSSISSHDPSPNKRSKRRTSPVRSSSIGSCTMKYSRRSTASVFKGNASLLDPEFPFIPTPKPHRDLESLANLTCDQLRAFARPGGIIVGFVFGIGPFNRNRYAVEASLSRHGRLRFARRACDPLGKLLPTYAQKGTLAYIKGIRVKMSDVAFVGPFRRLEGEEEVRAMVRVERKEGG